LIPDSSFVTKVVQVSDQWRSSALVFVCVCAYGAGVFLFVGTELVNVRAMVKMLGDGRLLVELSCILSDRALYSIDRLGSVEKQDFAFFEQSGYNRSSSDL
jgi:hypothetical protein